MISYIFQICLENCSSDSLSTGAAVALSCTLTFLLSVTTTAIITFIIIYMCVKNKFERKTKANSITLSSMRLVVPKKTVTLSINDMKLATAKPSIWCTWKCKVTTQSSLWNRDQPIMLIILPIKLCCTAHKVHPLYILILMLNIYLICSTFCFSCYYILL